MDLQKKLGILGFDPKHNQIGSSLDDLAQGRVRRNWHELLPSRGTGL